MQWDEEDLNRQGAKMIAEDTRATVLVVDDTGFASKGPPRSGSSGNIRAPWVRWATGGGDLLLHRSAGHLARPHGCTRPKTWAHDPERRHQARVPRRSRFKPSRDVGPARSGAGRGPIAVWWPMPTTETTRTSWRAGGPAGAVCGGGPHGFPSECGAHGEHAVWRADELLQTVPRQVAHDSLAPGTKGWLRSLSRYVVGASPVLGTATRAGWWGSVRPGVARGAEIFLE